MPHKFDPARRAHLEDPSRAEILPPRELLQRAGVRRGMHVADIGCGPGFFTFPAASLVGPTGTVYAIDISEEMLQVIREKSAARGSRNVIPLATAENALPLPDQVADVALVAFVLHEAEDRPAFLREVARILKPGGRVLLLEWDAREMPMGPPTAERLAPPESRALLEAAGIAVVEEFAPNPFHYGIIGGIPSQTSTRD